MTERSNHFATAADWRTAARRSRASRAEPLTLPSGATILAARPEPLEWILSGRIPQRLLAAALGESQNHPRESGPGHPRGSGELALDSSRSERDGNDVKGARGNGGVEAGAEMTRDDVLELARFAAQMVKASVVEPAIGDGVGEIPFDDIPVEDRAFIFQWACRALSGPNSTQEDLSSPSVDGLERFCQK